VSVDLIKLVEQEYLKEKPDEFVQGDTVRVLVKIVEGNRERTQAFEGVVLGIGGTGVNRTFTVRRVTHGVGIERTFLLHSPRIERVEVVRRGRTRRARLYFLRERVGKKARLRERR
jgi:large subunit ribosomal protein L19